MKYLLQERIRLPIPNAEIWYFPNFLTGNQADRYFETFKNTIAWQQDDITLFGKTYPQPRLTALHGNNGKSYSYSNVTMKPKPFTEELLAIKQKVETMTNVAFTTCLLNLYRDGRDSNGWHSDDEKELGKNPVIASVSLGAERYFHLRYKKDKSQKQKLLLQHGSLLLMQGETQHHWQHQLPKTAKKIGDRINLTFRIIK